MQITKLVNFKGFSYKIKNCLYADYFSQNGVFHLLSWDFNVYILHS